MKLMSVLILPLWLSACFVTRSEGDQLQSDLRQLKDEIAALQREQYDSLHQINHTVKDIKSRTSVLENVSFKQNADEDLEKEHLKTEVQELRGKLEETQYFLEEIKKAKDVSNLEVKESALAQDKSDDDYFSKGNELYQKAKDAKKSGEKLALYKQAVLSFQELLTRFPSSKKVPETLFKVGNSLEAMGFSKDAIVFYEEVIAKHSKSSFVKDARSKVVMLKNKKK